MILKIAMVTRVFNFDIQIKVFQTHLRLLAFLVKIRCEVLEWGHDSNTGYGWYGNLKMSFHFPTFWAHITYVYLYAHSKFVTNMGFKICREVGELLYGFLNLFGDACFFISIVRCFKHRSYISQVFFI